LRPMRDRYSVCVKVLKATGGLPVYWFSVNGKFAFEGLAWLRDRANR
jgi:hypothetical protein